MLRNVASNWALSVLQILLMLVLTPFVKNQLGEAGYGVWESVVAATMPLQLLALGLPMATVRAISSAAGSGDLSAANRVLGTALTMTLFMGAMAAGLGAALFTAVFDGLFADSAWLLSAPEHRGELRLAVGLMVGTVAAGFALRLPYAVFDAHRAFVPRNVIMAAGFVTRLALTLTALRWRPELSVLAAVQACVLALECGVAIAVSRRLHPGVHFRPSRVNRVEARSLLSFSVFALLLNMGALLAFRLDNLVIQARLDELAVTVYAFGAKVFDPMITLLLAIGSVIMPLAASAAATGELADVRRAFLVWSRTAALIVALMGSYIVVLGPDFLRAWLDASDTSGRIMQILMLSFVLFLPVRSVALPVLMGLGRARVAGLSLFAMGALNLALSLTLIGPYGVLGVALGTAIPNVLFSLYLASEACRALGVSMRDWLRYAFGRPALPALATGILLALGRDRFDVDGFGRLLTIGVVHTLLFAGLTWAWVLRGDPWFESSALARRFGIRPR